MLLVDIKPLLKRLNPYTTRALEGGIGLCLSRTHYEVTVEHLLAKLLEDPQSDVPLMLRLEGVDVPSSSAASMLRSKISAPATVAAPGCRPCCSSWYRTPG